MNKIDEFILLTENTYSTYLIITAHFKGTPGKYVIYTDIELLEDIQFVLNKRYEKDFNFTDKQFIKIAETIREYYKNEKGID